MAESLSSSNSENSSLICSFLFLAELFSRMPMMKFFALMLSLLSLISELSLSVVSWRPLIDDSEMFAASVDIFLIGGFLAEPSGIFSLA